MGSVFVVIREIFSKYPPKMVFTKDNDVIGTFASNASIQSFDVSILPRAAMGRHDFFYLHRFDAASKPVPIKAISVPEQESRCSVPWKRFDNLLRGPFGSRMLGYVEVNYLAPGVAQYDEYEQQSKPDGGHDHEVHSHHFGHVVLDKRLPCLGRRLRIATG